MRLGVEWRVVGAMRKLLESGQPAPDEGGQLEIPPDFDEDEPHEHEG
jgi:hypothetical protein